MKKGYRSNSITSFSANLRTANFGMLSGVGRAFTNAADTVGSGIIEGARGLAGKAVGATGTALDKATAKSLKRNGAGDLLKSTTNVGGNDFFKGNATGLQGGVFDKAKGAFDGLTNASINPEARRMAGNVALGGAGVLGAGALGAGALAMRKPNQPMQGQYPGRM